MGCPSKHQMKYYKVVSSTMPKLMKLMTPTEICHLFEKRSAFAIIYGNGDLLVNDLYSQCPICVSIMSLEHFNDIIQRRAYMTEHIHVHLQDLDNKIRCKYKVVIYSNSYCAPNNYHEKSINMI